MLKAVLFDLDGTLLDTIGDIEERTNTMLSHFGYPPISRTQAKAYVGDGARMLVERALPQDAKNTDECYAYFKANFAGGNALTALFPDERECLLALLERGIKLAVITNKPQDATDRLVEKFFNDIPFGFVGGDSGMFACKPDPSLAQYCALRLRVAPGECAFVGDGETDVRTALNAGMFGISALWGYRSKEQLTAAGATVFAQDFSELEKILLGI